MQHSPGHQSRGQTFFTAQISESIEKDWTYRLERVWAHHQLQLQHRSGCRSELEVGVVYGALNLLNALIFSTNSMAYTE